MTVSRSKVGPAIAEGAGTPFAVRPRFIQASDIGAIRAIHAAQPESRVIWRKVLTPQEQAPYLAEGRAGGTRLAGEQLAELRRRDLLGAVRYVHGLNECMATGEDHRAALDVALTHAEAVLAAGLVPIELNVQVGNLEESDVTANNNAMAHALQWLWSHGAIVGYHGYWDERGTAATWPFLAGRYQTITGWLRAAGVTAQARWAITECGLERFYGNMFSGPIHQLVDAGTLTEAQALAMYVSAYMRYNADPQVVMVLPFTWWHQSVEEWRPYDLAVGTDGQPWRASLEAHNAHWREPGMVNDPQSVEPPVPPPVDVFPKDVWVRTDGPGDAVNLRDAQGADIGDILRGTKLRATGRDAQGRLLIDARVAESVTQGTPPSPPELWTWPVVGQTAVTQAFGVNPTFYGQYNLPGHEGLDLRAPNGTQVVAVADGTIMRVDRLGDPGRGNYGYSVRQTAQWRGRHFVVAYAHGVESSCVLKVGDHVKAGDLVMKADATGNVVGGAAHLHLTAIEPGVTYTAPNGTVWPRSITDPSPMLGL